MRVPVLTRRAFLTGLVAAPIAGCAEIGLEPPLAGGVGVDNSVEAISFAQDAFAVPGRMRGNPAWAARAVAQVEFLAVDLQRVRWFGLDPLIAPEMQQARGELRGILGVAPDARPQTVIDQLMAASVAIGVGRMSAPELDAGIFTRGQAATLALLSDLPATPRTTRATARAAAALQQREFQF